MQWQNWSVTTEALEDLIRRQQLAPSLLRRLIEEEITSLVALTEDTIEPLLADFFKQQNLEDEASRSAWLDERAWTEADLKMHVCRPEALKRFGRQRFGPGVEEHFLERKSSLDTVLYSMLRVRDPGLARELWIQISEGEIRFEDAAAQHSDGPEANSRGLLGPIPLGNLQPELAERLRHLQQGAVRPPEQLGPWCLLLRLEKITPARLDDAMRERLIQEQLDHWINARVERVLKGEEPDELNYDQQP